MSNLSELEQARRALEQEYRQRMHDLERRAMIGPWDHNPWEEEYKKGGQACKPPRPTLDKELLDQMRAYMPPPVPPPRPPLDVAIENLHRNYTYGDYDMATDSPKTLTKINSELKDAMEYHKALAEVVDYFEAQMGLDMFKDKPKAKEVYEKIIKAGLEALLGTKVKTK